MWSSIRPINYWNTKAKNEAHEQHSYGCACSSSVGVNVVGNDKYGTARSEPWLYEYLLLCAGSANTVQSRSGSFQPHSTDWELLQCPQSPWPALLVCPCQWPSHIRRWSQHGHAAPRQMRHHLRTMYVMNVSLSILWIIITFLLLFLIL